VAETRSWLESRHLGRSTAGAEALELHRKLEPELAESLLAAGDEIARASVALAHRFFVGAVRLASERPEHYAWWQALITEAGALEAGGRPLVQALLELDPVALSKVPGTISNAWREGLRRVGAHSTRLAAAYARALGSALSSPSVPPRDAEARLAAWADAVLSVSSSPSWRAELLAGHVAESAHQVFALFDSVAVSRWARLNVCVGNVGRSPRLLAYPKECAPIPTALHAAILDCALVAAEHQPSATEELVARLGAAVAALPPRAAVSLLDAARSAATSEELSGALLLVPAVAHEHDDSDLAYLCAAAVRVAAAVPDAAPAFLRSMNRGLEAGGKNGFEAWLDLGLELGATNSAAARAHFRLETRTAHKLLTQHSAAVTFEEVEGLLQRYMRMLARRSVRIVSGPGIWLRPLITTASEPLVRFPERVGLFSTAEENQAFYVLSAAHAAGRFEYGTHAFSLDLYVAKDLPVSGLDLPRPGDGITDFLEAFPNPLLAVGLFTLVDGLRIDARLMREFPGLAGDIAKLGRTYVEQTTIHAGERLPEELVEALFLVSIGGRTPSELPDRLSGQRQAVALVRDEMTRADSSVYDAAALTARLYWTLTLAFARAGDVDSDYEGAIEIGGATVIDPLEHLESGGPGPPVSGGDERPATRGPEDPASQSIRLAIDDNEPDSKAGGMPLSPEELRDLIERGVELSVSSGHGDDAPALGLYITDLIGKLPSDVIADLSKAVSDGDAAAVRTWLSSQRSGRSFAYDEWDHRIDDYRRRWCRVTEEEVEGDGGAFFTETLERSREIVDAIKREFRMMRPEQFRKVRGMQHGDDFDLNALVDAQADRKGRKSPPERLYVARRREERDVATLFLLDMSASTDEPLTPRAHDDPESPRRVIDVTKETLVLMASVLDEIGDAYAVYGFSGHGRRNVEVYPVKSFSETLGVDVKSRLGGIEPKRSTRMGAALRHAASKIAKVSARARHLILLSDGFPQDYDYGDDRTSNVYGIRDTTVALRELEFAGVQTFCVTVDPAGHDYLGDMCAESSYAVIEDVGDLPVALPRIYRTITRL
jgi:nitric oxide reductase NorD protein